MKTCLIALFASLLLARASVAQELVTLSTRESVTQSFFLLAPVKPHAIAILFPGGPGFIRLRSEGGEVRFSPNNFLVRSREHFVASSVAVAIVDAPSDMHVDGMHNSFRKSEFHLADIRRVAVDLRARFPGVPLFVIGTSMGTVSAAHVGHALGAEVAGIVLTASVFLASGRRSRHGDSNLSEFDLASIKAPVLLAHHRDDGCVTTPYSEASLRAEKLPLISVRGGDSPRSKPCAALSPHGFLGKERETVDAIVSWMLKKPYRNEIE
jgi:predicted alpha/beta-hydrolase family hydrolase